MKQFIFLQIMEKDGGEWKGEKRPEKEEYFIELDIPDLHAYDDFIKSQEKEYKIKLYGNKIKLNMLFLEYNRNGCATLRIGNSIIEIETGYDERFWLLVGEYVSLLVENIVLYDENI